MFYHSLRVGKKGKLFYLLKLKTMKEHGGIPTASKNDPRLTKNGKWLRRYKLDELPTIFNLIKGDISIIGCRPDTPEEIETLDQETKDIVLSRKPGIISPATLWNYKEDETLSNQENPHQYYTQVIKPVKYFLNVWYIQNRTFLLDFKILLVYTFKIVGINLKLKIYPPYFNEGN